MKMISLHSTIPLMYLSLLLTMPSSAAFLETRSRFAARLSRSSECSSYPTFLSALVPSTEAKTDDLPFDANMVDDIIDLCAEGNVLDATKLLSESENSEIFDENYYVAMFKALKNKISNSQAAQLADELIDQLNEVSANGNLCRPTAASYNAVIIVWASSNRGDTANSCLGYLDTLWSKYNETGDANYVPLRSSYIHTINALARSRQGYRGAKRAESLLDDLEGLSHKYPRLGPNTMCYNAVLNAWSKSGVSRGAGERCEEILHQMISLCDESGRKEVMPDTTSFNTIIHTLAKSKERNRENRAEALLELMNELSEKPGAKCKPDQVVSRQGLCESSFSFKIPFFSWLYWSSRSTLFCIAGHGASHAAVHVGPLLYYYIWNRDMLQRNLTFTPISHLIPLLLTPGLGVRNMMLLPRPKRYLGGPKTPTEKAFQT